MKFLKQFCFILSFFLFTLSVNAQRVPSGINYQAVLRDAQGQVIADKPVKLQISVNDPETRSNFYTENHAVTTNNVGIFTVVIGSGVAEKGTFGDIPWSSANTWLEVAYDIDNNGTYEIMGTTRMLSVPYAFYAEVAGNVENGAVYNPTSAEGGTAEESWMLKGNKEIDDKFMFLGSKNFADLVIKTHDKERIRISKGLGNDGHDGHIYLEEDVTAEKSVQIDGELFVGNKVTLKNDLLVFGNTTLQSNLNVNGSTIMNGGLDVYGNTNLRKNVVIDGDLSTFQNSSIAQDMKIGDDLLVEGDANFKGDVDMGSNLHVKNDADIDHNLNVDNNAEIHNDFKVGNNAEIENDLLVGNNAAVRGALAVSGAVDACRVVVDGCVSGSDSDSDSYPMYVKGSNQGIYIQVDGGRNEGTNFVTFADGNGIWGRVEGQTPSELHNSFEYIWTHTMNALETALNTASANCSLGQRSAGFGRSRCFRTGSGSCSCGMDRMGRE